MKPTIAIISICTLLLCLVVPQRNTSADALPATAPTGLIVKGTVHSIHLPETEPSLPPGPGRETVQLYCGMCHTSHYIMIQPPFSRETWITEVTKMRKTFSGPIPEDKVAEIVDYCMSVRGVQAK